MVFEKVAGALGGGKTLYYAGCLTKQAFPEVEFSYKEVLNKLGIKFANLDFDCCGSPCRNMGYNKDFKILMNRNLAEFKKTRVKRIITNCPSCYHVFKNEYKMNVEHVSTLIWRNIQKFPRNRFDEQITYHDPCYLGRHSGIYDEPRDILKYLGFKVVEMKDNREKALCCGAAGGFKANFPEESDAIARKRLEQVKTHKLITFCPLCYTHMKDNAKNIDIMEFSEVLV